MKLQKIFIFGLCLITLFGCSHEEELHGKETRDVNCRTELLPFVSWKSILLLPRTVCG